MSFRIQFCQSTASESGSETTADDSGSSIGRAARRRPRAARALRSGSGSAACGSGISLILLQLLATFCFVFVLFCFCFVFVFVLCLCCFYHFPKYIFGKFKIIYGKLCEILRSFINVNYLKKIGKYLG